MDRALQVIGEGTARALRSVVHRLVLRVNWTSFAREQPVGEWEWSAINGIN